MSDRFIIKLIQIFFGCGFALGLILAYFTKMCILSLILMSLCFLVGFISTVYFGKLRFKELKELEKILSFDRTKCWLYNWLKNQYDNKFYNDEKSKNKFIEILGEKINIIHKNQKCKFDEKDD